MGSRPRLRLVVGPGGGLTVGPRRRLALEHLTLPSASPLEVVRTAASRGWGGASVLVQPFAPFPQTAATDLARDTPARRAVRDAADELGVAIALAWPFVVTSRSDAASWARGLDTAAEIGAQGAGLLVFDRDADRARDTVALFAAEAALRGLRPVLEFYGGSAVRTLAEAEAIAASQGAERLELCVDLLHLVRAGGAAEDVATVRGPIAVGQISDAPLEPPQDLDREAAFGRRPPGEGGLDLAGFIRALPAAAWIGLEAPPNGLAPDEERERALRAMQAAERLLA